MATSLYQLVLTKWCKLVQQNWLLQFLSNATNDVLKGTKNRC